MTKKEILETVRDLEDRIDNDSLSEDEVYDIFYELIDIIRDLLGANDFPN